MIWKNYELEDTISKATQDVTLWKTERGILEINENTLAIPIRLDNRQRGYIFHGSGKLLLDTIVETKEGAIGKPVDNKLDNPFIMLGNPEETQKSLTKANEEDLAKMGYKNQEEFVAKAEDLCNQFFHRRVHSSKQFDRNHGLIFAFQNEEDELDILIAKDSKMVYKAADITFVSKKDKVVLKSPDEVVCQGNGKSVIVHKDNSIIIKK